VNILILNWLDPDNPQAGGAEVHLHEIFRRIVARGHSVTLLCSGWPGASATADMSGIKVHRTGGRHTLSLAAPRYYRKHLAAQNFDVVVEDLNKVPFFAPAWVDAPAALLVHHLFGTTAFREASAPVALATCLLEMPIARVFGTVPTAAVSRSTADDLVRRGLQRDLIEVIPNGVDLEALTPGPPEERFAEPTLLYLGRLKKYKRVDLVIRAVAAIAERGLVCRLLIAGQGDHRDRLESLRDELGLSDWVEFLGFVSDEKKLEMLRRSWVHVLASPKEGWGIANLEAAACGTPTVASDSPGLRDSVVDGRTGYLVPHGSLQHLADRIAELLGNEETRFRMGQESRAFAERFSWDESALAMEQFLETRVAQK
jgi:glycosyltransferase involved in cell wall biosynthesis